MEKEQNINECVKESITIALLNLMRKKCFSEIKITEIVNLAGVGRTSFYRNFESKEDVLKKHINNLYCEYFLTHKLPDFGDENDKRVHMLSRFRFVKRNAEFFVLLNRNGLLYEVFEAIDNPTLEKIATIDVKNRYSAAFMTSACVGVIKEWIERKFKESEEELVEVFMNIV